MIDSAPSHTVPATHGVAYRDGEQLLAGLQAFQAERIGRTYADLKQDPEYHQIGQFFFNELYGARDFSFRDTSIRKLHRALDGKLDRQVLSAVEMAFDLQELSEELDQRMVEQMIRNGYGPELTMTQYRRIYRQLDNFDQRMTQVELATDATLEFHRFSQKWIVGVTLKTVRRAAHLMGMGPIMDFVYDGYTALKHIRDVHRFTDTILERERDFNESIFQ